MTYTANNDPAREFLDSVRYARLEYHRLSEKVKLLETQCEHITATLKATPGGGSADTEKIWAALADESGRLYRQLRAVLERTGEVEDFIEKLPDPRHRLILKLRYLDSMRWPEVNRHMSQGGVYYSDRQMFRLHGEALNSARALWAATHEEEDKNAE